MSEGNYYRLDNILKEDADYNLIFGERGNGKSYAIQEYAIQQYLKTGKQIFLLRRWIDDVKEKNAQNFWDGNLLARLSDMTDGEFTNIEYKTGKYYLCKYDGKGKPVLSDENIIGYVWSVSESERLKGQSFPNVSNIVYEEFISLSRDGYHPEELTMFLNIISTIVRDRTDVKVWLLGNTVNKYNPYFKHFDIRAADLKQGQIYTKMDTEYGCKVAIEFCGMRRKGSLYGTSAKYYAFGSGVQRKMIVQGGWQTPDYPKYSWPDSKSRKIGVLGIEFDEKRMELLLLNNKGDDFCYVRQVKDFNRKGDGTVTHNVLCLRPHISKMYYIKIQQLPEGELKMRVMKCLDKGKVFFKDNDTGEYFNNYMRQAQMTMSLS